MKKLIGLIVGNDESSQKQVSLFKSLSGFKEHQLDKPLTEYLPASLKISKKEFQDNQPLKKPLEIKDFHIRHFFSKLDQGVVAVGLYLGKSVNTPSEAYDYFKQIGGKAFGEDWLLKHLVADFKQLDDGDYLVTGLNIDQSKYIKEQLQERFVSVGLSVSEKDSEKVDYILPDSTSGSQSKRIITQLINKIKGNKNDRPTTNSRI